MTGTTSILGEEAAAGASGRSLRAGVELRAVRTLAELDRIAPLWERLAPAAGNPVANFAYRRAWAAGLQATQQLSVFVAEGAGGAAIAPLVVTRGGAGWLTLLAAEMYEILDFLGSDEAALRALAGAVARTGRPLFLQRVPTDSPVVGAIRAAYRGRGVVLKRAARGAPWIPLDASWAEPEAHLNSGRRSDLRRARRSAEKAGRVEIEILAPDAGRVPALVEEVFRVEAAGWKGVQGSALAADPVRGPFFRRYAQAASEQGTLRMCFLRIDGRAAAAQIAVDNGQQFSLLRAGYDEEFSHCSPGMLLTLESIRYAARQGLCSYEFNGEVEPWTKVWTGQEHACCSIRAYPFEPRGLAALAANGWRALAGRVTGR
jgi:CelD/BcsL family acetyltransferase involved in cellulose biosynthesis